MTLVFSRVRFAANCPAVQPNPWIAGAGFQYRDIRSRAGHLDTFPVPPDSQVIDLSAVEGVGPAGQCILRSKHVGRRQAGITIRQTAEFLAGG